MYIVALSLGRNKFIFCGQILPRMNFRRRIHERTRHHCLQLPSNYQTHYLAHDYASVHVNMSAPP